MLGRLRRHKTGLVSLSLSLCSITFLRKSNITYYKIVRNEQKQCRDGEWRTRVIVADELEVAVNAQLTYPKAMVTALNA